MQNKLFSKVFLWMFAGLLLTFITGFYAATNEQIMINIFMHNWYYLLIILELGLVIFLSARAYKMRPTTARISFLLYAFVSGLTFSSIFIVFDIASILWAFLISAFLFALLAVIGYVTKIDLTKWSTYLFVGLIGVIICSIINLFLGNSALDIIISSIAILIFLGFTAYDVQKIKRLSNMVENENAIAIIGALELYLDFINIFLNILSLTGKAKN